MGRRLPRLVRPELDRAGRRGLHRLDAPRAGRAGGLRLRDGRADVPRPQRCPARRSTPGPQPDSRLALEAFLAAVRSETPLPPPITLADARAATLIGLLARKAVDERRVVSIDEIQSRGAPS